MKTRCSVVSSLAIIFLVVGIAIASAAKLPSTWKTCVINQPNTDACLKKSAQTAIGELAAKGSHSLGVFPIDPMRVTELRLHSGSGSVALDLTFSDLDIYGFKNLSIDQINGDFAHGHMELRVTITSDVLLNGNYTVKGRLLVVPIGGAGRCNITLGNPVSADVTISWHLQKQGADGRTFVNVDKIQFDFTPKTFKLLFHDKDHGDSPIGSALNRIANDNAIEILRDLKPAISVAFGQAFQDIANRIFSKVPYDEIFPIK